MLARARLRAPEQGIRFLKLLSSCGAAILPEFFGRFEPARSRFDPADPEAAIKDWGRGFLWRRRSPSVSGQVVHGPANAHDGIYVSMAPSAIELSLIQEFLLGVERSFGIELAYVHLGVSAGSVSREEYVRSWMPFAQGLTTHHLREGLPDIPWLLMFGPAYLNLFGRDRVLAAPAAAVKVIGNGVALQLTSSVDECDMSSAECVARRARLREHLDTDAFRTPGRKASIPLFVFESVGD